MPLTRLVADAFGVVTICLVSLLVLLGLFCILYLVYFRSRIQQGFVQLGYFNGPWIIRITFVIFAIWWCFGEIIRLSLLRREGRVLNAISLKWQKTVCSCYLLSNLGFAEPCLFLTFVFLLRASLQRRESGTLSRQWNGRTAGYIFLYCLPVFVLQLIVIFIGPKFNHEESLQKLPLYFTSTAASLKVEDRDEVAFCIYPLLSTVLHGMFATLLTTYLLWLGRRMVTLVINKGLRRRVYMLIFSVSCFLPLRVLLLGFSVLSRPEHFLFEALAFSAFVVLLYCAGVGICILVYYPVADSLTLGALWDLETRDLEVRTRSALVDHNDTASLIPNQRLLEASTSRNSDASMKRVSISFRAMLRDESSPEMFEELSLFSPGTDQLTSPPVSPPLPGQPMLLPKQISEP